MRPRTLALLATPILAATIACGLGDDTNGPGSDGGTGDHTIVLEVTGPTGADITYGTGADQSQDNGATVPWRKEIKMKSVPIAISLVAQSKGTGAINCKITVDGKVTKENTSNGQFAVVTCAS